MLTSNDQPMQSDPRPMRVDSKAIPVTTVDIREEYDILGQVYVQVANRGEFSSHLQILREQYTEEIDDAIARGQIGTWGPEYGSGDAGGQLDFEHAFYIAVRELQKRAALMGADAIVGMRHDIDLDAEVSMFFFLQMYGTAVLRKKPAPVAEALMPTATSR